MSKQIYLYSEDKKYKCGVELADSTDHFDCPEHSIMILTEERENGTYVIAEARDKLLETEKDKEIDKLKLYQFSLERETIHKIFEIIDGLYNTFGWIDCVRFDEFKDKVLEEYDYNYGKGEKQ